MSTMNCFELKQAVLLTGMKDAGSLDWAPHSSFKGVFLKHIITGTETGGMISSHIVRLEPFSELGEHKHQGMVEIHEVVSGTAECMISGSCYLYECGVTSVIPADALHSVKAGKDGLCLMAKFSPALL